MRKPSACSVDYTLRRQIYRQFAHSIEHNTRSPAIDELAAMDHKRIDYRLFDRYTMSVVNTTTLWYLHSISVMMQLGQPPHPDVLDLLHRFQR